MQNKIPFEIILHVGRVTSVRSWVTKKSCHGQTLIVFPKLSMKTVQVHLITWTTLVSDKFLTQRTSLNRTMHGSQCCLGLFSHSKTKHKFNKVDD